MDLEWEDKLRERMAPGGPAAVAAAGAMPYGAPPAAAAPNLRFAEPDAAPHAQQPGGAPLQAGAHGGGAAGRAGGGFLAGFGANAESRAAALRRERAGEYAEFMRRKEAQQAEQRGARGRGAPTASQQLLPGAHAQPPQPHAPRGGPMMDHVGGLLGGAAPEDGARAAAEKKAAYAAELSAQIAQRRQADMRQRQMDRQKSRERLGMRANDEAVLPFAYHDYTKDGDVRWVGSGPENGTGNPGPVWGAVPMNQQQQPMGQPQQFQQQQMPQQFQQQQAMQQQAMQQQAMQQQAMQQPGFPQPSMMAAPQQQMQQMAQPQQQMPQMPPYHQHEQQQYTSPATGVGAFPGAPGASHGHARGGGLHPVDPRRAAALAREEAKKADYARVLQQQIADKKARDQERKRREQLADERKMREAANYNPWGRGGGGAPLKDDAGNVVTDLNDLKALQQAHQYGAGYTVDGMPPDARPGEYNRAMGRRPGQSDVSYDAGGMPPAPQDGYAPPPPQQQQDAHWAVADAPGVGKFDRMDGLRDLYGNVSEGELAARQRKAEKIHSDLNAQIEEKKRRKQMERERERAEEEREEERLRREQQKMREAFEREQQRERAKRDAKLAGAPEPSPAKPNPYTADMDAAEAMRMQEDEVKRMRHERLHKHERGGTTQGYGQPPPFEQRIAHSSAMAFDEMPAVAGYRPPPQPQSTEAPPPPPPPLPAPVPEPAGPPPALRLAPRRMAHGEMVHHLPADEVDSGNPRGFAEAAAAAFPVDDIMGQIKAEFRAQQDAMRVAMSEQMAQVEELRRQTVQAEAGAERAKTEAANLREAIREREGRDHDVLAAAAELRGEMRALPERMLATLPRDAPPQDAPPTREPPRERAPSAKPVRAPTPTGGLLPDLPLSPGSVLHQPSEIDFDATSRSLVAESTLIPVARAAAQEPSVKVAAKEAGEKAAAAAVAAADAAADAEPEMLGIPPRPRPAAAEKPPTSAGTLGLGSLWGGGDDEATLPSGAQTPASINLDLIHRRNLERLSKLEALGREREADPDQLDVLLKRFLNQSKMPGAEELPHLGGSRPGSAMAMEKSLVSESNFIKQQ